MIDYKEAKGLLIGSVLSYHTKRWEPKIGEVLLKNVIEEESKVQVVVREKDGRLRLLEIEKGMFSMVEVLSL